MMTRIYPNPYPNLSSEERLNKEHPNQIECDAIDLCGMHQCENHHFPYGHCETMSDFEAASK